MAGAQAQAAPVRYMQGIAVPAESVRPVEFFARTRRQILPEVTNKAFAGLGGTDTIEIKKTGILAGLWLKFSGTISIDPGTGTAATTARWPYDLAKKVKFTANGQANVINVSGLKLKAREPMTMPTSDRGVAQTFGGATVNAGTLSMASESWGVGSKSTISSAQNAKAVELVWFVPVAEDRVELQGAIFAATSTTDLTLTVDWSNLADLVTLSGNATASVTGNITVLGVKYSIPESNGQIVVPDLGYFHSMIESRSTGLAQGENEIRVVGQGAGKTLLRDFFQVWSNGAPLAMNAANFGPLAWRYSTNETPDYFTDGQMLREVNERSYNADIGGIWGFGSHEFAEENAFRDSVDMGAASEFRKVINLVNAPTNGAVEYVTETIFRAGAGA